MFGKNLLLAILFTIGSFAARGQDNELNGSLELVEGASIPAVFENSTGRLQNGPIRLVYSSGWFGSAEMQIFQNYQVATLSFLSKNFTSFFAFDTGFGTDSGQSFSLSSYESDIDVNTYYETGDAGCFAPGACTVCEYKTEDGVPDQKCEFKLHDKCPGTQEVYRQVTVTRESPVVSVIDNLTKGRPVVGMIKGVGKAVTTYKTINELTDCVATKEKLPW